MRLIAAFLLIPTITLSQGLIQDRISTELIKLNPRVSLSRSIDLPSSVSLEIFTPHVFDQGDSDMCTAYSLALARTIVYARNNQLTNKNKISAEAYSPYYIYTKYKSSIGDDFDGGLNMYFNKLNEFGYAKMKHVEYPHYYPFTEKQLWEFSVPTYLDINLDEVKSEKFDVINCIYMDDAEDPSSRDSFIKQVKSEINKGRPVIFGLNIHDSFAYWYDDFWSDTITMYCSHKIEGLLKRNRYCNKENVNPSGYCDKHKPNDYYHGHAMTLIGYDDDKYGGSFLVQNSWGKSFGTDGKIWINYESFATHAEEVQSLDKAPRNEFETIKSSMDPFNYSDLEFNASIKDFTSSLDVNWILFTPLAIRNISDEDVIEGTISLPNNLSMKGEIEGNLLNGIGELNLNDIYVYKGAFVKGSFNGQGVLIKYDKWGDEISVRNGVFDEGEFISGTAWETITSPHPWEDRNGFTYNGEYDNKDYNGQGSLTHNQYDYKIIADFEDGWPIYGEIIAWDGYYHYLGELYDLEPHGKGVLTEGDVVLEGNFSFGKYQEK